jgi:hypothetical protein
VPDDHATGASVGKKKDPAKDGHATCGSCRNFNAGKKGGYCKRRDKKRSADEKTCGHFDPR